MFLDELVVRNMAYKSLLSVISETRLLDIIDFHTRVFRLSGSRPDLAYTTVHII